MKRDAAPPDVPQHALQGTLKYFFIGGVVTCLLGALIVAVAPVPMPRWPTRGGLVLAWLAVAGLLGAISWRGRDTWSARFVAAAAMLAVVLLFVLAYVTGQGLRTISLSFVALLICLAAMLAGLRIAALLWLLGLIGVLALVWLEDQRLIDTAAAIAIAPAADALIAHALVLSGGLAAGVLIVHASARARGAVEARERQYADLLSAAADHFWELDEGLRIVQMQNTRSPQQEPLPDRYAGRRPWELEGVSMLPSNEAHADDLRAHRPFDNLQARRRGVGGREQHMIASGRPRFGTDGRFIGYWIVGRDVTALVEHQAALERARDEAKAASRAKSAFLANMSHEIRTPLHGVVGMAELARDPATPEPARREYLDRIGECAAAVTAIIGDVLDLSRIEAGKLQIAATDFDLHELVHSLQRNYDTLGRSRGLDFQVELAVGVPRHVRGDAVRLRQILTNYLGNALKFTPRGSICLRVTSGPGSLRRFEVQDTGIGIALTDQALLFEAFTQVDDTRSRRFEGTGLGLSICRELALLMGGSVGLSSEPGHGSRFWVELPLPLGQPIGEPGAGVIAATGAETLTGRGTKTPGTPGAQTAPGSARLAGLCVLLVEDNPVNQIIGRALLERWGMVVALAEDGFQAVGAVERAAAAGRLFDLVLMDLQMPGRSGYDAAAELRTRWDSRALPIVALTAAALDTERAAALAAGMDELVTKPIDSGRLESVILQVLQRRSPAA